MTWRVWSEAKVKYLLHAFLLLVNPALLHLLLLVLLLLIHLLQALLLLLVSLHFPQLFNSSSDFLAPTGAREEVILSMQESAQERAHIEYLGEH